MREQLKALREKMKEKGIDIYVIPTNDYHGSEYMNDHFKCREFVSGFTGSAGTLIVTQDFAGLWTDGRYFIQAAQELDGSGIDLMKMGEKDVPKAAEYVNGLPGDLVVGFDGRVMPLALGSELEKNHRVEHELDLVGEIWKDRPEIVPSKVYSLDLEVTGEDHASKVARVRECMGDADFLLVSRLEDVAWLYNLRGRDVAHTPVFYGYALISGTEDILYLMDETFAESNAKDKADERSLPETVTIKKYDDIFRDLRDLRDCSILLDEDSVSFYGSRVFHRSVERVFEKSIVERLKAVKNEAEIAATKNAHVRDGDAMVNMLFWLKNNAGRIYMDEISLADHLEKCRKDQGAYDLSFETIAGYEEHGAVVHYAATKDSSIPLKDEGFVLIDSGGQYKDGTTDITRTVALGKTDSTRKKYYTAVLKSHIALACAEFDSDTTCAELDEAARKPLRELGLDFAHGTGHGVGHMLSVHEGPQNIGPRGTGLHIVPGMITSDEPGVYFEGKYGIRIENEILCVEKNGKYAFETITFCPYEREAIDTDMLTEEEKDYINSYHRKVYETLEPLLEGHVKEWLRKECAEI